MPNKKPVAGVSRKEQRIYEPIKQSAENSGRYGGRAKQVAARTVRQYHKKAQHPKGR